MDWFKLIGEAIELIEAGLTDKPDADGVSRALAVSRFYFEKMFATICGVTVGEYIRDRRLTLAGEDVLRGGESVTDIAFKYGYETCEGFTRAFTRFHGVTPSRLKAEPTRLRRRERLTTKDYANGGATTMESIGKRGYVVKETGAVYFTKDMDKTLKWFEDTLGWYGQIDARNDAGAGTYGCVNHIPMEIEALHIAPFTGIHLFYGEPIKRLCGFMLVDNVKKLYERVAASGWKQMSELKEQPWGARECTITTIDGSLLTFFEL